MQCNVAAANQFQAWPFAEPPNSTRDDDKAIALCALSCPCEEGVLLIGHEV